MEGDVLDTGPLGGRQIILSPELYPDERLNADLKQAMGTMVPARSKPKLWKAAKQHMTQLETEPHRVRAYFQDPRVQYAA